MDEFVGRRLISAGLSSGAGAAVVTFTVTPTGADTFDLTAEVTGGSAGLAGYNVELENVGSFDHKAPEGVDSGFNAKGFTLGNNASIVAGPTTGVNAIFSGQNTSAASAPGTLIYNVGISPGTAAAEDLLPGSHVVDTWGVPVLIGSGTFSEVPTFESATANVFDMEDEVTTSAADVVMIPEPATMSLLALGGLGVLVRRRRK